MKLKENISIKYVKEFFASLMDEIKNSNEVVVDFSEIRRVDLSVIQAIIVAGRHAKMAGKVIKLKSVSDQVKYQMYICGLKT